MIITEQVQLAIVAAIASCIVSSVASYFAYKAASVAKETKAIVLSLSRKSKPKNKL